MRNTYRDYFITKHGAETYNMLIQDTKDKYGYVSTDYAEEEVVCDSLVALQKKKGFAEDMAKTLYENGYSKNKIKKFFRTVADFFRKMADMVRSLFDDSTVTQAGVYAERDAAFLDKLSDSFFAGMRKVAEYNFEGVDGETRKIIVREDDGTPVVLITERIVSNRDAGISIVKALKDYVSNNFTNSIQTKGQFISIDKRTANEWAFSQSTRSISDIYNDKMDAFGNADELLQAAQDYVGEEKKHNSKNNKKFVEMARGKVDFAFYENGNITNGYTADIIIGTEKDGKAYLYDIVSITNKNIATVVSKLNRTNPIQATTATTNTIIPENSDLSTENKKKMLPEEQAELDRLKSELERKDAELAESKIEHERYVRTAEKTIKAKERLIQTYSEALAIGAGGNVVSFESVKDIVRGLNERYDLRLSLSDDVSELTKIYSHIANAKNTNSSELLGEIRQFVEKRVIPASFKIDDSLRRQYKGFLRDALEKKYGVDVFRLMSLESKLVRLESRDLRTAHELYLDTAGEIEVRDTAARMNLSAGEIKNTRPDIDRSDVVFAGNIGESHSLSPTKIKKLKESLLSLNKKNIILNADVRLIKVTTDDYTIDKNIFSVKGRTNNEVNARIKAIPEFEQILLKSRYFETDTNVRNVDKKAKKALLV